MRRAPLELDQNDPAAPTNAGVGSPPRATPAAADIAMSDASPPTFKTAAEGSRASPDRDVGSGGNQSRPAAAQTETTAVPDAPPQQPTPPEPQSFAASKQPSAQQQCRAPTKAAKKKTAPTPDQLAAKKGQLPPGKLKVVHPPRIAVKTAALRMLEATVDRVASTADLESSGFLTPSADSSGSMEQYNMDWNAADISEATSSDPSIDHPAGPGKVAQSLHALQSAVLHLTTAAEVSSSTSTISSPRGFGRMVKTRPS